MDLISPTSLHFSRAWEGGVESSHLEWARTRINVEKSNKHDYHQELALSIKRKKGKKSSHQLNNYYFRLKRNPKKTYHMEGKKCLVFIVQNSPFHSSVWTFQQWFPPHNPRILAVRFTNCWVWWSTAHSHRWKKWRRFPLCWLPRWFSPPWTHLPFVTEIQWIKYQFLIFIFWK